MTLSEFLKEKGINSKDIKQEASSPSEINDLFMMVERDLKDSESATNLSVDWQFGIAYNAALKLCSILVRSGGLRISSGPHHMTMFKFMPYFLGEEKAPLARYFDKCRSKRNQAEYERAGGISEKECKDLIAETKKLKKEVKSWMLEKHPKLMGKD